MTIYFAILGLAVIFFIIGVILIIREYLKEQGAGRAAVPISDMEEIKELKQEMEPEEPAAVEKKEVISGRETELEERILCLQREGLALKNERDDLKIRSEELVRETDRLQKEAQDKERDALLAQKERDSLKEAVDEWKEKCASLEMKMNDLKERYGGFSEKERVLSLELNKYRAQSLGLEKIQEDLRRKFEMLDRNGENVS